METGTRKAAECLEFRRSAALFWSRIRDSNPPPTAWEAWNVVAKLARMMRKCIESSIYFNKAVLMRFEPFRTNNAQKTHKTSAL